MSSLPMVCLGADCAPRCGQSGRFLAMLEDNPSRLRSVRTQRLVLRAVTWQDIDAVRRLKGNAASYGRMLGGVMTRAQVEAEMADDLIFWARHKIGIFAVLQDGHFIGLTGFHERPDGLGIALRFAFYPQARGQGFAREAASAALGYARAQGIQRIIAVASADNIASQTVLRSIGMQRFDVFQRAGRDMYVYQVIFPVRSTTIEA